MNEELKQYEDKMEKALKVLKDDYIGIRAGRANPHILDKVMVDYYGTMTPIMQLGNITVPEPRMILVSIYDKGAVEEVSKAIQLAELGINPVVDGNNIRLGFPELTEDRRKELAKDIKKRGEDAKVAIRNIRRDGNDAIKKLKGGDYSEDTIKDMEDELQKLTDKYVKLIEDAINDKSKEVMTV